MVGALQGVKAVAVKGDVEKVGLSVGWFGEDRTQDFGFPLFRGRHIGYRVEVGP